jgi:hypothetical protein
MTTDEAFAYALKVCEAQPDSSLASHLEAARMPLEFLQLSFLKLTPAQQIAACVYFISRAGIAVLCRDDDPAVDR